MFLAFLTACIPLQAATPPSIWGEVITLGQTEQAAAPVLWAADQRLTAAWIGADRAGVHQDAIIMRGNRSLERAVLPLPPVRPFAQQFILGTGNNTHLLWLDADTENENRLFAALITPTMQIERGPTLISNAMTLRYAAVSDGSGGIWTVWSGRIVGEPLLYAQYIDNAGRPYQPVEIASSADWPSIVRANDGTFHIFWLQTTEREIYHATLENGRAVNSRSLGQNVTLMRGDRLIDFRAALDSTYLYVFWNITRMDGTSEAWYTSANFNSNLWSRAGRLGFGIESEVSFNTGFNGGAAKSTLPGTSWVSWAAPMAGQFDTLPVAAYRDGNLVIIYLRDGLVAAYQTIVALSSIIGAPSLSTDRNRHLYLAWAEPNPAGYADMKLTTTRP